MKLPFFLRLCLMCLLPVFACAPARRDTARDPALAEPAPSPAGVPHNPPAAAATTPPTARLLTPGDQLRIRLPDFVAEGVVSEFKPVVDAAGHIELPQLGRIAVKGLTLSQVSDAIVERAPYALVYPIDGVPTPEVELLTR